MSECTPHPASFRDPGGFVFAWHGTLYRQVNTSCAPHYAWLKSSGLYDILVQKKLLVPHEEIADVIADERSWYKTLRPERLPWISYPYEWCSRQLKDAALLTLSIMKLSAGRGMILKDATPYNIQFHEGKPVFIDTLSFEKYDETRTWVAYRQFCEMFLFPLYLAHYLKTDAQKLLEVYPEGIPAAATARLLPFRSRFNLGVRLHVLLQKNLSAQPPVWTGEIKEEKFSKQKLLNLLTHLDSIIRSLSLDQDTTWSHYYSGSILSKAYLDAKENIFRDFIGPLNISSALDIGANDGYFSRILAKRARHVIAIDDDGASINKLYKEGTENILPLVVDITNPSPARGFNNMERASFHERIRTELVVALAVIHHLAIGKNIPLNMLAGYFNDICTQLIIEWVPREDEKVQQMLMRRKDVFADFTEENFVSQFSEYFNIHRKANIPGSKRVLYFLLKK